MSFYLSNPDATPFHQRSYRKQRPSRFSVSRRARLLEPVPVSPIIDPGLTYQQFLECDFRVSLVPAPMRATA
jgi:hypothetical protein